MRSGLVVVAVVTLAIWISLPSNLARIAWALGLNQWGWSISLKAIADGGDTGFIDAALIQVSASEVGSIERACNELTAGQQTEIITGLNRISSGRGLLLLLALAPDTGIRSADADMIRRVNRLLLYYSELKPDDIEAALILGLRGNRKTRGAALDVMRSRLFTISLSDAMGEVLAGLIAADSEAHSGAIDGIRSLRSLNGPIVIAVLRNLRSSNNSVVFNTCQSIEALGRSSEAWCEELHRIVGSRIRPEFVRDAAARAVDASRCD